MVRRVLSFFSLCVLFTGMGCYASERSSTDNRHFQKAFNDLTEAYTKLLDAYNEGSHGSRYGDKPLTEFRDVKERLFEYKNEFDKEQWTQLINFASQHEQDFKSVAVQLQNDSDKIDKMIIEYSSEMLRFYFQIAFDYMTSACKELFKFYDECMDTQSYDKKFPTQNLAEFSEVKRLFFEYKDVFDEDQWVQLRRFANKHKQDLSTIAQDPLANHMWKIDESIVRYTLEIFRFYAACIQTIPMSKEDTVKLYGGLMRDLYKVLKDDGLIKFCQTEEEADLSLSTSETLGSNNKPNVQPSDTTNVFQDQNGPEEECSKPSEDAETPAQITHSKTLCTPRNLVLVFLLALYIGKRLYTSYQNTSDKHSAGRTYSSDISAKS